MSLAGSPVLTSKTTPRMASRMGLLVSEPSYCASSSIVKSFSGTIYMTTGVLNMHGALGNKEPPMCWSSCHSMRLPGRSDGCAATSWAQQQSARGPA